MNARTLTCPNCGASLKITEYQCEYCGSYVIISNEKYRDFSDLKIYLPQEPRDDPGKYPGIYVFGRLLGKGEKPITLGVANYYTGLVAAGGKLLLTSRSLSFSAHGFNVGRKETRIEIKEITDVKVSANLLVSQHILVTANGKTHKFVVYHGNEWVKKIKEAIANYNEVDPLPVSATNVKHYSEELQQLKQLMDLGVITEEEFTIKKRMLLGI